MIATIAILSSLLTFLAYVIVDTINQTNNNE